MWGQGNVTRQQPVVQSHTYTKPDVTDSTVGKFAQALGTNKFLFKR